ncbi:MAG: FtsQ-type POTRA domain-containing protein [Ruminococcus sp.]|nr:FtsQ-type POTRA domain-containing protein [Ruminococcus sp.]
MAENRKQSYGGAAVRHYRKKNTLNLYLTVAAGVLAAIAALLSVNVFFNLSPAGLTINGCTLYTPEQIQHIGGLVPGQNLVRLNTMFVEQRLKENLVYIEDVQVVKEYPEGLRIDIIEARAKAQLEHDGKYCTVSETGRLLEIDSAERNKKLPLVVGFELVPYKEESKDDSSDDSSEQKKSVKNISGKQLKAGTPAVSADEQKDEILAELFKQLGELEFKKIVKIDITDRTDIKLIYDNRIQIELGSSVDLDIKLLWIKSVIDKELPDGYEGTLRYNGIDSGISAIAKQEEVPTYVPRKESSEADSSETDDSSEEESYDEGWQPDNTDTDTDNGGYTDPNNYSYDNGDGGYGYDDGNYGYDDGGYGGDTWYDPNGGYDYDQNYDGGDQGYYDGQTW